MTGPTVARDSVFTFEGSVKPEWIDINGHMNVAYYVLAFDLAVDKLWANVGITDDYVQSRQYSTFAVESHITYKGELMEGDRYRIDAQILAIDDKRVHQFQRMYHATKGYLAATAEWLNLHVNLETRRVYPWPPEILAAFIGIAKAQATVTLPVEVGKIMRVPNALYSITDEKPAA